MLDVGAHAAGSTDLDHEFGDHFSTDPSEDRSILFPRYVSKVAKYLARTEAAGTGPRTIRGSAGLPVREETFAGDTLSLFGIERTNVTEEREARGEMYDFAAEARQEQSIRSRKARAAAAAALDAGDDDAYEAALDELTPQQRRQFFRDLETAPRERIRRQVPRTRRDEFDDLFPER